MSDPLDRFSRYMESRYEHRMRLNQCRVSFLVAGAHLSASDAVPRPLRRPIRILSTTPRMTEPIPSDLHSNRRAARTGVHFIRKNRRVPSDLHDRGRAARRGRRTRLMTTARVLTARLRVIPVTNAREATSVGRLRPTVTSAREARSAARLRPTVTNAREARSAARPGPTVTNVVAILTRSPANPAGTAAEGPLERVATRQAHTIRLRVSRTNGVMSDRLTPVTIIPVTTRVRDVLRVRVSAHPDRRLAIETRRDMRTPTRLFAAVQAAIHPPSGEDLPPPRKKRSSHVRARKAMGAVRVTSRSIAMQRTFVVRPRQRHGPRPRAFAKLPRRRVHS